MGRHTLSATLVVIMVTCAVVATAIRREPPLAPAADTVATAPQPGTYTGQGFDTCAAPSSATMRAWLASPYRAVGIYFGGPNRACTQPNLTASWVTEQVAAGWHLLPLYMGLQAPCTTSNKRYLIDPTRAAAQGRESADDAVAAAERIGLPAGSVLILDMEAYRTGDAACRTAVLDYVSAFNARLHYRRYFSGFYSSLGSGVADQVAVYPSTTRVHPDYLDFARWDDVATVDNPAVPSNYWTPQRRIKQYRGDHTEAWGGVTLDIDTDYLDVAPLPETPFGDFTGDGWSDLLVRDATNGRLYRYPGNGVTFRTRVLTGTGWNAFSAITRFGDLTGDGHEDVLARDSATGVLWRYPGTGSGFGARVRLGPGWNGRSEITAVGDMDGDGHGDVLAYDTSTGILYFYPGTDAGFGPRISLGPDWNTMTELAGVGDFDHDGFNDLLAIQKATGYLFFYPGVGVGFGPRVRIGTGWNALVRLVGVGDFDRDGFNDVFAVEKATGNLYLYPGRGRSLGTRIRLGTGWQNLRPVL